jgi:hypothetical protein
MKPRQFGGGTYTKIIKHGNRYKNTKKFKYGKCSVCDKKCVCIVHTLTVVTGVDKLVCEECYKDMV